MPGELDYSVQGAVLVSVMPTQLSAGINTIRLSDGHNSFVHNHTLFIPKEGRKDGKVAKSIDTLCKDASA